MNEDLFEKLAANKKYSDVCPDTIRRVITECEGRYKKAKDMEKAVREKLHGITSAFNDIAENPAQLCEAMADSEKLESLLKQHASTRERLPLTAMDALYTQIFAITGTPAKILDLACGLNPLYLLHRMNGACSITGVDVSKSCVSMLDWAAEENVQGVWGDLLCENAIPAERFDIALLFKILPLLDRQRSGAAMDVMNRINAKYLVISFPTRTLGGRNVGMEGNYSQWMETHLPENCTIEARFTTENELFYILKE